MRHRDLTKCRLPVAAAANYVSTVGTIIPRHWVGTAGMRGSLPFTLLLDVFLVV